MLKKFFKFLSIALALFLLLCVGWFCVTFFFWPKGSMWLWPAVPVIAWLAFGFYRRLMLEYRTRKRLRTTLSAENNTYSPDQEWILGVTTYLKSRPVRISSFFDFINNIPFINKIPYLDKYLSIGILGDHQMHFVMGMPGSGKSTLIQRSNFGSGIGEANPDAPISPTKSCAISYMQCGIVVEIAGSHIDPAISNAEREYAWNNLLSSIKSDANPRKISSIIICLSPSELSAEQIDVTLNGFRNLQKCVSDLMAFAQIRIPIYVVLTHIEEVNGMGPFIHQLDSELLMNSAGSLATHDHKNVNDSIEKAVEEINRFLPWLAMRSSYLGYRPGVYPLQSINSFNQITNALKVSLSKLFIQSEFFEAPLFRGLFLSTDLRKIGVSVSDNLDAPRLAFGTGIFEEILPHENIYLPLTSYETVLNKRLKILWGSYYSVICLLAFWFFLGFSYQSREIGYASELKLPESVGRNESIVKAVNAVASTQPIVDWVDRRSNSIYDLFLPFSWVTDPLQDRFKRIFLNTYMNYITHLQQDMNELVESGELERNSFAKAVSFESLIFRLRTIQYGIEGYSLRTLKSMPLPQFNELIFLIPYITEAQYGAVNQLYAYLVAWSDDRTLRSRLIFVSKNLQLLADRDENLAWLKTWANKQVEVQSVFLSTFWAPTTDDAGQRIAGAYTQLGKKEILKFIANMNDVRILKNIYTSRIESFLENYEVERDTEWRKFALNFRSGTVFLKSEADWLATLSNLRSSDSPYARLKNRLLDEFPQNDTIERPSWVNALALVDNIKDSAQSPSLIGEAINRLDRIGKTIPYVRQSQVADQTRAADAKEIITTSAKPYGQYLESFNKALTEALLSSGQASALASNFSGLGRDSTYKSSLLRDAYNSYDSFEKVLSVDSQPWNEPAWALERGPLKILTDYSYREASCSLQSSWESSVVFTSKLAIDPAELNSKLYGDNGTLMNFLNGPAKPYLILSDAGFINSQIRGWSIPWELDFLPFVNSYAKQTRSISSANKLAEAKEKLFNNEVELRVKEIDSRVVTIDKIFTQFATNPLAIKIESLPISANSGALIQPYGAELTLNCSAAPQQLTQLNFSDGKTFNWNPNTCGTTELAIFFGNNRIKKIWLGQFGFNNFLNDFRYGKKIYTSADFPESTGFFKENNIQKLNVAFKFLGDQILIGDARNYELLTKERAMLLAEKSGLEVEKLSNQTKKLQAEITALSSTNKQLPIPTAIAPCKF